MTNKKNDKRLGRGLKDMLKRNSLPTQLETIQNDVKRTRQSISIDKIRPNPYQPRTNFDEEKLSELASSIKEHGIFTPILVRLRRDKYEIVAGERRYRAAKQLGLKEVPVIVEEFDDNTMMEIALIENIQRDDLNAMEEARAYQNIIDSQNLTQQDLANKIGKTRPYIANFLRLLTLPKNIQDLIASGKVSSSHARTLVGLEGSDLDNLVKKIQKEKLNVRQTEQEVKKIKKRFVVQHEKEINALIEYLKTNVSIDAKYIKIQYKDDAMLQELVKKIISKEE